MKTRLALAALCAVMALSSFQTSYAQMAAPAVADLSNLKEPIRVSRVGKTDKQYLRVIFLAGSEYNNFRIGMENESKSAVSIEVTDEKGMVVFTDRLKKVHKRIKEFDFSFLKRGEYVVRVFNDNNEFSKVLLIP
jgi:outer membrane lipoprotein-sorting protein